MGITKKIGETVYLLSIDENRKLKNQQLKKFENLWSIPNGISYNSYLIVDEKKILIETIDKSFIREYEELVNSIVPLEEIDIIIFNHLEPDHSGGILEVLEKAPNAVIMLTPKGKKIIKDLYPEIPDTRIVAINDGDEIKTGKYSFKFIFAPYLHWPETMFTYLKEEKILFTCDAFGSYLALEGKPFAKEHDSELLEKEAKRYYATIISPYGKFVQKALGNLKALTSQGMEIRLIAPSHGPIHDLTINIMIKLYDSWSSGAKSDKIIIIYGSMYGHTASYVEKLKKLLVKEGLSVQTMDSSYSDVSEILSELLDSKVMIFATPTYDAYMFPPLEYVLMLINHKRFSPRPVGLIGKCSWSGGGLKKLRKFVEEELKFPIIEPVVELKGGRTVKELDREINLLSNNILKIIKQSAE